MTLFIGNVRYMSTIHAHFCAGKSCHYLFTSLLAMLSYVRFLPLMKALPVLAGYLIFCRKPYLHAKKLKVFSGHHHDLFVGSVTIENVLWTCWQVYSSYSRCEWSLSTFQNQWGYSTNYVQASSAINYEKVKYLGIRERWRTYGIDMDTARNNENGYIYLLLRVCRLVTAESMNINSILIKNTFSNISKHCFSNGRDDSNGSRCFTWRVMIQELICEASGDAGKLTGRYESAVKCFRSDVLLGFNKTWWTIINVNWSFRWYRPLYYKVRSVTYLLGWQDICPVEWVWE